MSSKKDKDLQILCEMIADNGLANAADLSKRVEELLISDLEIELTEENRETIYMAFSFLNWTIANGIWSNLKNTELRSELLRTSQKAFVLPIAKKVCESNDIDKIAFKASEIDFTAQSYYLGYIERVKDIQKDGFDFDANATMLYTLEWIQERLLLDDESMEKIILSIHNMDSDFANIEEIALQTIRAEESWEKKGFFERFLHGFNMKKS